MSRLAPTWLLSAQATDAAGDEQLRPGAHLRVLPSLELGLPAAPLLVARMVLGQGAELGSEEDVVWTDSAGERRFLPIDLEETGPVTGWLPSRPGDPVVWAAVGLSAEEGEARVDALVSGLLGPATVADATAAPWQVCATGMDRLLVSGRGVIEGVRILRIGRIDPGEVEGAWKLALPVDGGKRYRGVENAIGEAEARVLRGAAPLAGLHDQPDASGPTATAGLEPGEDFERVSFLWEQRLGPMLELLLNDTSAPPQRLRMPPEALSGTKTDATVEVPPLAALLQAALDPGVGRLLGLVEHDEELPGNEGDVVLYVVRGGFSLQPAVLGQRLAWLAGGAPDKPAYFPLELPDLVMEGRDGRFADLWTAAALIVGARAPQPAPPVVSGSEDLGWVPEVPPAARRHVALSLAGLRPGAGIALARETFGVEGLNPRLPELFETGPNRAIPIVCGTLAEIATAAAASGPGQGEVYDRGAPAEGSEYRVAQSDWFGRWSEWGYGSVAAGTRPAVPVPVLEAEFAPPTEPGEAGMLEVRCVQPRDPDLPPGGLPLQRLELSAEVGGGSPVSASVAAERGGAPAAGEPQPLLATLAVPPLAPAEQRWLIVSGVWVDEAGRASAQSPPTRAQAADPRGPVALTLPNTLAYGSRPDALGRSRVRLEWPGAPAPTAYRVYHSDETTLRHRLDSLSGAAADAARAQLAAARTAPDRAAVLRANPGLFDRSCFELLTATPLRSNGGRMAYEHELSGSLGVLAVYRVVPVGELGAEAPFGACTLLLRGVPNTPPPPVPSLTVTPDPADPARAVVAVSVPAGSVDAVRVRLRRSRVSGADALGMPIVAVATPATWPARLADAGAAPWAPTLRLAPWFTYTWRAEVQGPPEPGSERPGAWSQASAPASMRVLPPAPGAASPGAAVAVAGGVEVTFGADEPLEGGPDGDYALDVYRRVPPGSAVESGAVGSFPAAAARQPDGSYVVTDPVVAPAGTAYLVEIADPLGRRGPRTEVAVL